MGMNPMASKLPSPAAFRLLSDLNDFLRMPQDERDKLLIDYMTAVDRRVVAEEAIAAMEAESQTARTEAAEALREAHDEAKQVVADADGVGKQIVAAATEQAESVTATARESAIAAKQTVTDAKAEVETLRQSLKDREEAVTEREDAVKHGEAALVEAKIDAEKTKDANYRELVNSIKRMQDRPEA